MNAKKFKAFFLPVFNSNSYQSELKKHLEKKGVEVEFFHCSKAFPFLEILRSKPDILHLHWLHPYFLKRNFLLSFLFAVYFVLSISFLRLFGFDFVWTCHNLKNHEGRYLRLDYFVSFFVSKISRKIIVHSEYGKKQVSEFFSVGENKVEVIKQGNYVGVYKNEVSKEDSRKKFSLSKKDFVFLFLGEIREYKGIFDLIEVFSKIKNPNFRLLIVGRPFTKEIDFKIKIHVKKDERILYFNKYVCDEDLQLYFNSSDVCVYPYRDIFHSGALVLGISFGKPFICSNLEPFSEEFGNTKNFFFKKTSKKDLKKSMENVFNQKQVLKEICLENVELAKKMSWEKTASKTLDVYGLKG